MRSLPKLIPGVHPKLPGDAQDHVKRIYAHTEDHQVELNLYIRGEEADEDEIGPGARGGARGRGRARARRGRGPTVTESTAT